MATQDLTPVHSVAVLALDWVIPFELGIPSRVLGAADGRYDVRTFSVDGRPVRSAADYAIVVDNGPEILRSVDTVVIAPFGPCPDGDPLTPELPGPIAAVLDLIRPGTRIVSICTGAYVLAAAGLLDGRPATTHWQATELFRSFFPEVKLQPDVLFVDDGDVLTAAGAAAGMDLFLHLVRQDHGAEVAHATALRCVLPEWRDGAQTQCVGATPPQPIWESTEGARRWALAHLHEPFLLADLAQHARMSLRTFSRRFSDEVGISPGRWIIAQRVARARLLLETTDLPVDEIADRVGFATGTSLRQHLRAATGVAPLAYRRAFLTAQ